MNKDILLSDSQSGILVIHQVIHLGSLVHLDIDGTGCDNIESSCRTAGYGIVCGESRLVVGIQLTVDLHLGYVIGSNGSHRNHIVQLKFSPVSDWFSIILDRCFLA